MQPSSLASLEWPLSGGILGAPGVDEAAGERSGSERAITVTTVITVITKTLVKVYRPLNIGS